LVTSLIIGMILSFATSIGGCKKAIRKAQENFVLEVMTNGTWVVTKMAEGSAVTTSAFDGYEFQFKRDRSVDAIKNGVVMGTGNWDPRESEQSIYSNFSSGSEAVLQKLNGVWQLYSVSFTTVKTRQTKSGLEWNLDLAKK